MEQVLQRTHQALCSVVWFRECLSHLSTFGDYELVVKCTNFTATAKNGVYLGVLYSLQVCQQSYGYESHVCEGS